MKSFPRPVHSSNTRSSITTVYNLPLQNSLDPQSAETTLTTRATLVEGERRNESVYPIYEEPSTVPVQQGTSSRRLYSPTHIIESPVVSRLLSWDPVESDRFRTLTTKPRIQGFIGVYLLSHYQVRHLPNQRHALKIRSSLGIDPLSHYQEHRRTQENHRPH